MKIFITGLTTVHWGRMEYGNVGNFYIVKSLFEQINRVFPEANVTTTFQMTDEFIEKYNISVKPMDIYYSWKENDLDNALQEFAIAQYYNKTGKCIKKTSYIEEIISSDIIIDLSGDMWGDYAEHVGENRFLVNLLKIRVAQLFGKKTILFAGSQGPFEDELTRDFAQIVYENYTAVLAREPQAIENVKKYGFDTKNTKLFACPAFLFEPVSKDKVTEILDIEKISNDKTLIGVTICGFNMDTQPYDKWPREDSEYDKWVEILEDAYSKTGGRFVFISHSNGFELPPNFKPIHGRDYPILKQLQTILINKGNIPKENLLFLEGVYSPEVIKGVIGNMDMMITGRVHASVAAISQNVPTVFIPYTDSMKSTKILGFATLAGVQEYVASETDDIKRAIERCYNNRNEIRTILEKNIPKVKDTAKSTFDYLKRV
ncbi:polysaccharide pyruvyl transferase family protein [Terrisporobacter sp.]|uniref:polysaccharide pyruvyl transferase family protein n=1 Tax=Terrisporobacter sp. TaxID=1965305 RepID=UPI00289B9B40|nr:polysaccharide pyruvyl transferase family protein [Terrisporobacter sp.]